MGGNGAKTPSKEASDLKYYWLEQARGIRTNVVLPKCVESEMVILAWHGRAIYVLDRCGK